MLLVSIQLPVSALGIPDREEPLPWIRTVDFLLLRWT